MERREPGGLVGIGIGIGGVGFEGGEGVAERRRCFLRECGALLIGSRCERVVAVIEHPLSEVAALGGCLDAKVAEHGIGPPAAHEADMVGVDASHHKRGRAAGAEGPGREEVEVDACSRFEGFSTVPECIGDVLGFDIVPGFVGRVVVATDRRFGRSPMFEVEVADASEGFDPTEQRVVSAFVADLLAFDGILLVIEREVRVGD